MSKKERPEYVNFYDLKKELIPEYIPFEDNSDIIIADDITNQIDI